MKFHKYKMEKRLELRAKMKKPVTNLETYVVKTIIDFKEELETLEKDNIYLKRDNEYLHKLLEEKNFMLETLFEEVEFKNAKIEKFMNLMKDHKLCYSCSHIIDCGRMHLCSYCKKWLCYCCVKWCSEPVTSESNCINVICKACFSFNDRCPLHNITLDNTYKELLLRDYYVDRYKQ